MPSLFGTDVAVNPQLRNESRSFNGKTVRQYAVDLQNDVSGSLGPDGALRRVLDTIALRTTPIMISGTYTGNDDNSAFNIFVEGDFPTDTYDGENSETFAAFLQTEIRALTAVDGVTVSGATVTEDSASPYFADDVEADY